MKLFLMFGSMVNNLGGKISGLLTRTATMVTDVIDTVVDTIQGLLAGIGSGIVVYFEQTFLITDTSGVATDALNPVGIFIFVLLGIGAAFGLATLVFNLVRGRS